MVRKNVEVNSAPDKVLYTDGREVTVTDSTLQVKNNAYKLNGVTRCGMQVLAPRRAPGIILLIAGLALLTAGMLQALPSGIVNNLEIGARTFGVNTVAAWSGVALSLLGILVLGIVRERYAVRIATAEGEKDAVVSDHKEYIHQIVDAINQAISYVRTSTASKYFSARTSTAR